MSGTAPQGGEGGGPGPEGRKDPRIFRYRSELPHPAEKVFRWHLRPGALERLTPPWVQVRVLDREGGISDGGSVTLQLRRGPLSFRWTLRHTAFEENVLFRDEQESGPFARWVHEHRFQDLGEGRSAVEDVVEWQPPLGGLGELLGPGPVERQLARLFAFRHARLAEDLERHGAAAGGPVRTVAISGASGFVGGSLAAFLSTGGFRVRRLVRDGADSDEDLIPWNPRRGELDIHLLEGVDAVVHLAGEPIAGVRWTATKKRAIRESRVRGTTLLARAVARMDHRPQAFVSASGVNYYGDRGNEVLTEESRPGEGFLADVCQAWEGATEPAVKAGVRTVSLRTGMVLAPSGGALGTMLLPFQLGLGGRLGSGRQYVSWIDRDDHLALILHCLQESEVHGPVNATAPHPVPNATFTGTLGRVLGRPTLVPAPAFALRTLLGEMGEELLLSSVRAIPRKAQSTGFHFAREGLEEALRHQLGRIEE